MLSASDFQHQLAARSATLDEHLRGDLLVPDTSASACATGEARLRQWKEVVCQFSADGLGRRLAWDGIDVPHEVLAQRLRPGRLRDGCVPAAWTVQAWRLAQNMREPGDRNLLEQSQPHPFEDLLIGAVAAAGATLDESNPAWRQQFTEGARRSLCRDLLRQLSDILGRALEHEFSLYRVARHTDLTPASNAIYLSFIAELKSGHIGRFLIKYAAATREATLAIEQWISLHAELARHLAEDRHLLAARFPGLADTPVLAAQGGLSDRHEHGRTVVRLCFGPELTLYYKPRSLQLEAGATQLLSTFGAADLLPATIACGGHGWVAEATPGSAPPADYYQKAGQGLAMCWLLAATDLHDENVIASSRGPVIVDGEMFASPIPAQGIETGGASYLMNRAEDFSVLRSGLLPRWLSYGNGNLIQVSGLTAGRIFRTNIQAHGWRHVNSDAMALHIYTIDVTPAQSAATLPAPWVHAEDIVAGFRSVSQPLLQQDRRELLMDVARQALGGAQVRFLMRDTSVYTTLLNHVRHPRHSLTMLDREIQLESLTATFVTHAEPPHVWPLMHEEKEALLRGDVPRFTIPVDSCSLAPKAGSPVRLFDLSGIDTIAYQLGGLTESQVQLQESLIRASLASASTGPTDMSPPEAPAVQAPERHSRRAPSCLEASRIIARQLLESALPQDPLRPGSLTWIAPQLHGRGNHTTVRALGSSLYDGRAGIGLFFAALAHIDGDDSWRTAALGTFGLELKDSCPERWSEDLDSIRGGAVGRASVIYSLRASAHLLQEPSLAQAALRLQAAVHTNELETTTAADWVSGLAGEALVLGRDPTMISNGWKAAALARLQALATPFDENGRERAWPLPIIDSPDPLSRMQTGLSHGAAGIVQALALLGKEEPGGLSPGLRELVTAGNRFIDRHWDASSVNWRASAGAAPAPMSDSWAHGAPGILLVRACPEAAIGANPELAAAARARLARRDIAQWDHWASGNCGLIDMWLALGEADRAMAAADAMLLRAGPALDFRIPGSRFMSPGLFNGLAGIGFMLLRVAAPERLPSPLAPASPITPPWPQSLTDAAL